MNRQLPLEIRLRAGKRLQDYLPGENLAVMAALESLQNGRDTQVFIAGPRASGRTHLLLGLCSALEASARQAAYLPLAERDRYAVGLLEGMEQVDLIAVDDIDAIAGDSEWENALFHLYNRARALDKAMVFTADRGPAALRLLLPDLRTRLAWGLSFQLQTLCDRDKQALIVRQARQRGLELPSEAAAYILSHYKRDTGQLVNLIDELDQAALAAKRRLTLPFIRDYLQNAELRAATFHAS